MQLTFAQKQHLYEHGYVKVAGVVPRVMVDAALHAINASLGEGMDPANMTIFRAQSFCPELQGTPEITNLYNGTPAALLAELLLGEGKVRPVRGGQIALRFPVHRDRPAVAPPHIDGMYSPTNGVPQGTIQNFTMLVGVFLSDVPHEFMGNFTVWPGTHHIYERYFREHGAEALLNGMPPVELPEPQQITANAGDVVFVHYQLAHSIANNVSPHIRYAVFFRLTHADHTRDNWQAPMLDIWMHWPAIRDWMAKR